MSRAGQRRHIIEIQEDRGSTQDTFGQPVENWFTIARPYAKITPKQGSETLVNGQYRADSSYTIEIPYRDGINVRHRIKWGSRILAIGGTINKGERGKNLMLSCKERV